MTQHVRVVGGGGGGGVAQREAARAGDRRAADDGERESTRGDGVKRGERRGGRGKHARTADRGGRGVGERRARTRARRTKQTALAGTRTGCGEEARALSATKRRLGGATTRARERHGVRGCVGRGRKRGERRSNAIVASREAHARQASTCTSRRRRSHERANTLAFVEKGLRFEYRRPRLEPVKRKARAGPRRGRRGGRSRTCASVGLAPPTHQTPTVASDYTPKCCSHHRSPWECFPRGW